LREDAQVEAGIGLSSPVERVVAVELLVENVDIDEVAGFSSAEQG